MPSAIRIPGSIYKLAENGVAVDSIVSPKVDKTAMRVDALICTPGIDRENEVIVPSGVSLANYTRNPVVLWDHGLNPLWGQPIAKSEHPDGTPAISLAGDAIEGSAYFTDRNPQSYQTFALIDEGVVRATSIHVIPITEVQKTTNGGIVTIYPTSEMLEWSFGCIGVNPETVAKLLSAGKLGGEPILDCIAKTLRPFAPLPSRSTVRVGMPDKPSGKAKTMTPEEEAAAKAKADAEAAAKAVAAGSADLAAADVVNDGADLEDATDVTDEKPTPRLLAAIKESLSQLQANVEAGLNGIENPDAEEFLNGEFKDHLEALVAAVDGMYSSVNGGSAPAEGSSEPPDEEALKSWLAGSRGRQLALLGYAAPLATLSSSKTLTKQEKLTVDTVLKNIRKTVQSAKADADSAKEKIAADQLAKLKLDGEARAKSLSSLTKTLKELLPANV